MGKDAREEFLFLCNWLSISQPDGLMDISRKKRCSQTAGLCEMRMSFDLFIRRENDNP